MNIDKSELRRVHKSLVGNTYKHYNTSGTYKVASVSSHTEVEEILVNYFNITDPLIVFSRPINIFLGTTETGVSRFIPITVNTSCCGG